MLKKLIAAKKEGCVAVVSDLVNASDGSVFPPESFRLLRSCCDQARICLLVDEAMTAIRCGAPLVSQRPEYFEDGSLQPDMVAFGKGMGISGVAINFNGLMMRHLAFHKPELIRQSIRFWRSMVTRPIATPVLIEALGILNLAEAEDWPARSEQIGSAFREFILRYAGNDGHGKEIIRGLGAFIAVDREISKKFNVMAAFRRRSSWARWIPKLNSAAAVDHQAIERYLVGAEAKPLRQALTKEAQKQGTKPLWCWVCGIDASVEDWCRICFLGYCGTEICAKGFHAHKCL